MMKLQSGNVRAMGIDDDFNKLIMSLATRSLSNLLLIVIRVPPWTWETGHFLPSFCMKFVGILPGITRTITTSEINDSKKGKHSNNEDKQTNTKHHQTPSTTHQQHTTNNTQQATHKKQQHATISNTQQATPNKQQPPNHTVTRVVAVHHDNDNDNVIGKKKTLSPRFSRKERTSAIQIRNHS